MEGFRIEGGKRIEGRARLWAAKNAVLPIMAAALMAEGGVELTDCPHLTDIDNMRLILEALGCETRANERSLHIEADRAKNWAVPAELSGRLRSSIFMMGPMLARFHRARVAYPGGCDIGQRPIDLHLKGLRALGARISEKNGMIELDGRSMRGGEVLLDFPSVGATENILMAASLARGRSVILNAAREPEIVDLARFINRMGGRIQGAGESRVVIEGVARLNGISYAPAPDRIVAGTLMIAAAITRGSVSLLNARGSDLSAVTSKLRECGCEIEAGLNSLTLHTDGLLNAVNVATQPYPGFPTDMQAQMLALLCTCEGGGVVTENVFENRFAHAAELKRMGADITVVGRSAFVKKSRLVGARVKACDLRAGAALTLAGLCAEGLTEIDDVRFIDRGYEHLETILTELGARISRVRYETEDS